MPRKRDAMPPHQPPMPPRLKALCTRISMCSNSTGRMVCPTLRKAGAQVLHQGKNIGSLHFPTCIHKTFAGIQQRPTHRQIAHAGHCVATPMCNHKAVITRLQSRHACGGWWHPPTGVRLRTHKTGKSPASGTGTGQQNLLHKEQCCPSRSVTLSKLVLEHGTTKAKVERTHAEPNKQPSILTAPTGKREQ